MITCPTCGKNIVDKAENGTTRLRTKLVLFEEGGAVALCPSCKTRVSVPLTMGTEKPKNPVLHYVKMAKSTSKNEQKVTTPQKGFSDRRGQ